VVARDAGLGDDEVVALLGAEGGRRNDVWVIATGESDASERPSFHIGVRPSP
jgi:hypothetical protein